MSAAQGRIYWGLRTFGLITGASRGIGQEIAHQFAQKFKKGSLMVLLARTESGLQKTKSMIESSAPGVLVKTISTDLSEPNKEEYRSLITQSLQEHKVKATDFEHAMIMHNAFVIPENRNGQLFVPTTTLDDIDYIQTYVKQNVTGPMVLNVQFLNAFAKEAVKKRSVLQTSSIASVMPNPGNALYSMTKVARNMYFQTLAMEDPSLDVFSYGPGPVDTELLRKAEKEFGKNNVLDGLVSDGHVLTPEKTVNWLVKVLTDGDYISGEFRDIFTVKQYEKLVSAFQG